MNPTSLPDSEWIKARITEEPYWFHRIELPGGIRTPGWSEPAVDKLPHYGLPADMTGMRVLDIGNAEGFFSFEAERRGAAEVIGIENYPPMARNFEICRAALGSRARIYRGNVYDLNPTSISLCSSELFIIFAILFLALQKIASVCTGTLLMQTATCDNMSNQPMGEFHRLGIKSGPQRTPTAIPPASGSRTSPAVWPCFSMLDFRTWSKSRRTLRWEESSGPERLCSKRGRLPTRCRLRGPRMGCL